MSNLLWWRSWHGAPMDHKWSVIAARAGVKTGVVSAIAWALFDYASQNSERGSVEGFDIETYAVYSGFSEEEIQTVIQVMSDKKIIVDGKLANWDKRQPEKEDPTRKERVDRFRENKRNETLGNAMKRNETLGNAESGSETLSSLSTSLSESLSLSESVSGLDINSESGEKNIYRVYEQNIGALTPFIAEELDALEKEYSFHWFELAVKESLVSTKSANLKYIKAILARWKNQGLPQNYASLGQPEKKEKKMQKIILPDGEIVEVMA